MLNHAYKLGASIALEEHGISKDPKVIEDLTGAIAQASDAHADDNTAVAESFDAESSDPKNPSVDQVVNWSPPVQLKRRGPE